MVEDEAAAVNHFGITPSRSVLAILVVALVVVVFDTGLQVQVGDNLPVGRDAAEGTVDYLFAGHAVEQPPGVVQVDGVGIPYLFAVVRVGESRSLTAFYDRDGQTVGTGLRYDIAVGIRSPGSVGIVVVLAVPVHIEVPRRGVELVDGVEEGTTGGAVFGLLVDVVGRDVNLEFVLEEREALTQGDVVTLELVGLDDTVGRRISVREIGLCHFRTTAQRDGVVEVGTHAVEVADVVGVTGEVIGRIGRIVVLVAEGVHALAPAVGVHREPVFYRTRHLCTVYALYLGQLERSLESGAARYVDTQLTLFTFLGGNHQYTVRSGTTVQGGRVGSFQHRNRLDVVGVELREGVAALFRAVGHHRGTAAVHVHLTVYAVLHGHTVYNDKGRVVTQHGGITTQQDFRSTTGTTRVGRDDQTGALALQRVDEVGLFGTGQLVAAYGLGRVGKRLFLTGDTHGGNHYLVEQLGVVAHDDVDFIFPVDGLFHGLVTDVGELQFVAPGRNLDRVVAVDVGGGGYAGAGYFYGEADEGFARGVGHVTGYDSRAVGGLSGSGSTLVAFGLLLSGGSLRKHDVGVLYRIGYVGPFEHDVENFADGFILDV